MHPTKRRDLVIQAVNAEGKVDINTLSNELNVSQMTIRRDLVHLEEEGKLIRTHGGAVLPKPLINEIPFSLKEGKHHEQKKQIAKKALSLVKEGQTILLDSGTTTLEIAKLLKTFNSITIVTNDIKIAAELVNSQLKVILTGGELQNDIGALFGPATHNFLNNINVDLFFLGAHAFDIHAGVTAPTFEKSFVKQLMMQAAESTWLVADHSKLEQKAFSKVCHLESLSGVVIDENIPGNLKTQLMEITSVC